MSMPAQQRPRRYRKDFAVILLMLGWSAVVVGLGILVAVIVGGVVGTLNFFGVTHISRDVGLLYILLPAEVLAFVIWNRVESRRRWITRSGAWLSAKFD